MGRRASGEGSIFRLPNGHWRVVVSNGFADGKRKRKVRHTRTRADAVAKLQELRESLGTVEPDGNIRQFLKSWLADPENNFAENTAALYKTTVNKHIVDRFGATKIAKVRARHVRALLVQLREAGVGTRTQALVHTVLSAAFMWGVRNDLLQGNPCSAVKKPSHTSKDINPFTREEVRLILDETAGSRTHAAMAVLFLMGLRQAEMAGLEWSAVDFSTNTIRVSQQAASIGGKVTVRQPKTKAGIRTLEMPTRVSEALQAHRGILRAEGLADCRLVFPARQGGYLGRENFRARVWNPLLKKLSITPHRGVHHARHSYATLSLGAGTPAHVVSKILGHSRPSVTLNLYAHLIPEQNSAARVVIDKLFA